jgi:hypothetical protein
MTLTLEIAPELLAALDALAAEEGLDPQHYVVRLIEEKARRHRKPSAHNEHPLSHLSGEEGDLLQQLNQGLPAETWERYHALRAKLRAEELSLDEQKALIALSDEIEAWNVRRLELLVELSRLRGVPLPDLMKELGLNAPAHA